MWEGTRGVGGATTRKQEVARADRETLGRERDRETLGRVARTDLIVTWTEL